MIQQTELDSFSIKTLPSLVGYGVFSGIGGKKAGGPPSPPPGFKGGPGFK